MTNFIKKPLLAIALTIGLFGVSQAQTITTELDSLSYSAGVLLANNLKSQGIEKVDAVVMQKAISDIFNGSELAIPADVADAYYKNEIQKLKEEKMNNVKEEGEKFLAENAKKEGVQVTASGLQYKVLVPGSGAMPKATDTVNAHYHGTLTDGRVFDSSVERGEPIDLPVNRVIEGWQEALQMMREGSKWRLFIPYNLAYGTRGAGPLIAPYSALVFDVEILKIK